MHPQELTAPLAAPHMALVAAVPQHGPPHLTPHCSRDDGQVWAVSTRKGRLKCRHLPRHNRPSGCLDDPPAASHDVGISGTATGGDQGSWDEASRLLARHRAPDQVDDDRPRRQAEPRVRTTVPPERLATRGTSRR